MKTIGDGNNGELISVSMNCCKSHIDLIDKFIKWGMVASRSEYMRTSLAHTIYEDLESIERVEKLLKKVRKEDDAIIFLPGCKPMKVMRRLE